MVCRAVVLHFERMIFFSSDSRKKITLTCKKLWNERRDTGTHTHREEKTAKIKSLYLFSMWFTVRSSLILGAVMSARQCKSLQSIGKFNHVRTWWQYFLLSSFFFVSLSLEHGSFSTVPNAQLNNTIWFAFNTTITLHYYCFECVPFALFYWLLIQAF